MRNFFTLLFTIVTIVVSAQIFTPVSWEFSQNQLSENEVELIFKASIDEHWHLYSQDIADDGPVPTSFTFIIDGDTSVKVLEEPKAIEEYDPNFEMVLKYFADEVEFKYNLEIEEGNSLQIDGYVDFMVCDEAQCLPPDYAEFSFSIPEGDSNISNSPLLSAGKSRRHVNMRRCQFKSDPGRCF